MPTSRHAFQFTATVKVAGVRAMVRREGIEIRVGAAVVHLADAAEHAGERGAQHQEVERLTGEHALEDLRAGDFRRAAPPRRRHASSTGSCRRRRCPPRGPRRRCRPKRRRASSHDRRIAGSSITSAAPTEHFGAGRFELHHRRRFFGSCRRTVRRTASHSGQAVARRQPAAAGQHELRLCGAGQIARRARDRRRRGRR